MNKINKHQEGGEIQEVELPSRVKEFFEYDVIPRYIRENPNASKQELDALKHSYMNKQVIGELPGKAGVAHNTHKNKLFGVGFRLSAPYAQIDSNLSYLDDYPTFVHENSHVYRQGYLGHIGVGKNTDPWNYKNTYRGSGYTPKEIDYLDSAYDLTDYPFWKTDPSNAEFPLQSHHRHMQTVESGASNSELRFRLWKSFREKLNKIPSIEEFDEYLKNVSPEELENVIKSSNQYLLNSWYEQSDVDKIKDAMIHVASNDTQNVPKQDEVVKAQHGWVIDKWQKAYNSKFGKGVRDLLYGQDIMDLSDEEYFKKHGYNKPIGGIGILGALVAPEWEGLEAPVVAENFGRAGYIKSVPWTARLKYTKPTNPSGFPKVPQVKKFDKFLQKSVQEQNDIIKFWNGERFSNLQQLQRNPQQYKSFQNWINKQ